MKQTYIALVSLAALAASAGAATPVVNRADRTQFTLTPPADARTEMLTAVRMSAAEAKTAANAHSRANAGAPLKAPEGAWTSLGTGTYAEDLLTIFSDVSTGQQWEVEIEQSAAQPGWYRLLPYASGPVAELLGVGDTENYLYINATDPSKVYAEDFTAFGAFMFSNRVPEMEWDSSKYGTLADNVITFPTQSFAYFNTQSNQWTLTTRNTGIKVYLPGAEVKDYAFKMTGPFHASDNKVDVNLVCGKDVSNVKIVALDGNHECSDENAAIVADQGTAFPGNYTVSIEMEETGMTTVLAVALDSEGKIVGKGEKYIFGVFDDNDKWVTVGTAEFTEGIYTASYTDIAPETVTAVLQENTDKAGYYRLVNPYAGHTQIEAASKVSHQGHNHYIYIDASRPDYVVVEGSPVGVDIYGDGAVYSLGARYAGTTVEEEAKAAGYFGTFDAGTHTIAIPDDTVFLGESEYDNGKFLLGNEGTKVVLNKQAGIEGVSVSETEKRAAAEYFNLQGQRVANPEGGLFICRQGSKVTKVAK